MYWAPTSLRLTIHSFTQQISIEYSVLGNSLQFWNISVNITKISVHTVQEGEVWWCLTIRDTMCTLIVVKCHRGRKAEWEWGALLNRVVEIGSQANIWERAFQAEGTAKAIKREHACQFWTSRRTVGLDQGGRRKGDQMCREQIMQGFVDYNENFGFYSMANEEPLQVWA